eukprot:contig_26024_g6404
MLAFGLGVGCVPARPVAHRRVATRPHLRRAHAARAALSSPPPSSSTSSIDGAAGAAPSSQPSGSASARGVSGAELSTSAALDKSVPLSKYVFPMRDENTTVFFDHNASPTTTVMVVFTRDRHGLVLDLISVLKALDIRCHRYLTTEDDSMALIMARLEGELVSIKGLGLKTSNTLAFHISDELSGLKVQDEAKLEQIRTCIRLELRSPYPRPTVGTLQFHRVVAERVRANRYSILTVQTTDRPRLLARTSGFLSLVGVDVASATIRTIKGRVENSFYVIDADTKGPLSDEVLDKAIEAVFRALRLCCPDDECVVESLWYQRREGHCLAVAEAVFIDTVDNVELQAFSKFETPNFRGRLPNAKYTEVTVEEAIADEEQLGED